MEALLNGTIEGDLFQFRSLRVIWRERDLDDDFQLSDAANRLRGHVLDNGRFRAVDAESISFRVDVHGRGHAGSQRGCDQISWGKRFTFTTVVQGCISLKPQPGLSVNGL